MKVVSVPGKIHLLSEEILIYKSQGNCQQPVSLIHLTCLIEPKYEAKVQSFGSSPRERLTQALDVAAVAHGDMHSAAVGNFVVLQGKSKRHFKECKRQLIVTIRQRAPHR